MALCAAPPLVALVGVLSFAALEIAGREPLTLPQARNLAEAAVARRPADVFRRLQDGEDPRAIVAVRGGFYQQAPLQLSALEGAILSRSSDLVLLVERHAGGLDGETRRHLACLAADAGVPDIARHFAVPSSAPCPVGADSTRQAVLHRGDRP
jgi:hypothetical protein